MRGFIYRGNGYNKKKYYTLYLLILIILILTNTLTFYNTTNTNIYILQTTASYIGILATISFWLAKYDNIIKNTIIGIKGKTIKDNTWKNFNEQHWANKVIKPYYTCSNKTKTENYVLKHPKSPISKLYKRSNKELLTYKNEIDIQNDKQQKEAYHLRIIEELSELTRTNQTSFYSASENILAEICKKTNSQFGIIYIYNNEKVLTAKTAFAVDRIKILNSTINSGEGIIGQIAKEKKATHYKCVPPNYLKISSGLGNTDPQEIYISPILYNSELVGVIELGSIHKYEEKTIILIEQLLKIIASAIRDTNNTENTEKLLRTAQEATQTMREQEEELKQNAEELQANHEELERKLTVQMHCIEQLQRDEDNVIINIAGRNRMLSQQIAFYSELIFNGKKYAIPDLTKALDLHNHSLNILKDGGIPKGINYQLSLPASNKNTIKTIEIIEDLWDPYKKAAEKIILHGQKAITEIQFIEDNTDELLKRNNDLVSHYMKDSDAWRKNVFNELSNVIRASS